MREGTDTEDITTYCFGCNDSFYLDLMRGDAVDCTATYVVKPQNRLGKVHGYGAVITAWEIHTEDDEHKYSRQCELEERGGLYVAGFWDYNNGDFKKVKWSNGEYVWLRRSERVGGAYIAGLDHRSNEVELYGAHRVDEAVETVWLVEGEKDVETLYRQLGLVGVSYHTVGDRTEKYGCVDRRDVVVLCDNDRKGMDNSIRVVEELQQHGRARSIRALEVFAGPSGYDVSDWVRDGGTRAALEAMVAAVDVVEITAATTTVSDGDGDWLDEVGTKANPNSDTDPIMAKFEKDFEKDVAKQQYRARVNDTARQREAAGRWTVPPVDAGGTLAEFLGKKYEPRPFYIEKLFAERHVVTVTGRAKTGKTTLTGNVVRSLADGVPFLGEFEAKQISGRIGMWNAEMDEQDYVDYLRAMGIQNVDKVAIYNLRGYSVSLLDDESLDWAVNWLKQNEVEIWIPDPWSKLVSWCGVDENDNSKLKRVQTRIEEIQRAAGVQSVLIPTHPNKAEGKESDDPSTRGGAVMEDWPDALWKYVKTEDNTRSLYVYGRGVDMPSTGLAFDAANNVLSVNSRVGESPEGAIRSEIVDKVMALIQENNGRLMQADIYASIGGRKQVVSDTLKRLESDGLISVERQGTSKRYSIAQALPDWPAGGLTG
jgi:DNA-binding transcriptional ArsR family regulator